MCMCLSCVVLYTCENRLQLPLTLAVAFSLLFATTHSYHAGVPTLPHTHWSTHFSEKESLCDGILADHNGGDEGYAGQEQASEAAGGGV